MADVSLPSRFADEERGQLFLITALAIAVLLVGLALILNTAIYTENIATRTTDTQLDDATSSQRAAVEASGEILDAENRNGGDASTIETQFDASMSNWSESSATLEASNGFTTSVSHTGTSTEGLRIHQDDPARNFTNDEDFDDWEPVHNGRVRGIWFNISRDNLSTEESDAFYMELDDDDDTPGDKATVSMHTDGTNVIVTVENDTVTRSCSVEPTNGDSLTIDIGSRTVGTKYCSALELAHEEVEGDVHLRFKNADEVTGTYELYATDDGGVLSDLYDAVNFATAGSGNWPVQEPALYDVNVTFTFQSSGTTVEKEIRIAPGEL
ncbi:MULTISPECIES: hypothetical protein [Haloferax]|uniref:Uncharacterized protein n=2 Tax=Haloferax TaxID=2251 RepID=A0A6G1Z4Q3_9EURY|nr:MULTISPECIES: hypothetical protein [Haloferax]KAB1188770.1 hypothetical protein Hfx1149_12280 [Haloferax sp. CBA1149]MRW81483.1 hypothetical protein [Haloferax marinisediminis]